MSQHVVVSFGKGREYEFTVHETDTAKLSQDQARDWLAREFETLECTPTNPMGKVLALDMILNVARYGGEDRFRQPDEWATRFAAAAAVALGRPFVKVDVANFVVG